MARLAVASPLVRLGGKRHVNRNSASAAGSDSLLGRAAVGPGGRTAHAHSGGCPAPSSRPPVARATASAALPVVDVPVDCMTDEGPLELWRHSLGHGGINPLPLPDRVVRGTAKLKPRLIRVFIQEFFQVYSERGRFDWSRLDPYMDALARTGAKVVAQSRSSRSRCSLRLIRPSGGPTTSGSGSASSLRSSAVTQWTGRS